MLQRLEDVACRCKANFILAIVNRVQIYAAQGYERVPPSVVTWLGIDDEATTTTGLIVRKEHQLVIRCLGGAVWPVGDIDLLRYLF